MSAGTKSLAGVASGEPAKKGTSAFKTLVLKLHLYLGLISALFLVSLGVTGAVIGFEQEIPRWLDPGLYYVTPSAQALPEAQLIQAVEHRFAPSHVRRIIISPSADLSQVMTLPAPGGAMRVFVNQYNGGILGSQVGLTRAEEILNGIHSFHLRIGMGNFGKWLVSVAGTILSFEVIFGLMLWWRLKRATIHLNGSWFRVMFDVHNAFGIFSASFLLLAAVTGVIIGFDFTEPLIYQITHSSRPPFSQLSRPSASQPVPGAKPISVDQAMAIANQAMPEATIATIQPPANPRSSYEFSMRLPIRAETSPTVHSFVAVDQYSGRVLKVYDLQRSSPGYVAIRLNRALHTGDIFGFPTHLLMSLTSLVLVVMVSTGIVIWWKKLAI